MFDKNKRLENGYSSIYKNLRDESDKSHKWFNLYLK